MDLQIGVVASASPDSSVSSSRLAASARNSRSVRSASAAMAASPSASAISISSAFSSRRALQPLDRRDPAVEVLALAHHGLGGLGVRPQIRVLGAGVELLQLPQRVVPVKDASSAVPRTA
jgi:hypothetical protein